MRPIVAECLSVHPVLVELVHEHSGKSLIGALAGGDLAIVLMKRAFGYRRSTGDAARHADGPAVGARELVSLDDIGGGRVLPVVS